QGRAVRNRRDVGSTAGDDLEIRKLHFERHRSSSHADALAIMPDLVDQRIKLSSHVVQASQIPRERVLRSNRFAEAIWQNRPAIYASANPIEMPGAFLFGPSREEPTPTSGRVIADSDLIYVRFGPLLRAQGWLSPEVQELKSAHWLSLWRNSGEILNHGYKS